MTKNAPPKHDDGKQDFDRRIRGMVSIAVPSDRVTKPVFGKHGFVSGALVVDWAAIVGSAVASHTLPLRIKFPPKERGEGTLEIKVASSAFATELQHLEPLIVERINGYFGWNAVARLRLRHGPLPPRERRQAVAPPEPDAEGAARLNAVLDKVEDPRLREALERLGKYVAAKKER